MDRCITCFRCIRICNEVQGQGVWQAWGRGDRCTILAGSPPSPLLDTDCVGCGACSDTCPTGAIEDASLLHFASASSPAPPLSWTRTVCPYCGTGCEMKVGVAGDRIIQILPVLDSPVNRGHLCVKGRYAHGYVDAPDRALHPMLRSPDGSWREVGWTEALEAVAHAIRQSQAHSGAASTALLSSARATNEDNYLAQKFARLILGTNNVDSCARVCHAPTAAAMGQLLGTGAATNSFEDIEKTSCFLLVGCNPLESHPIVGTRIRQATRRGARLIVIDPRKTELAECADIHLPLRPGTNIPLLNSLLHVIITEGLFHEPTLAQTWNQWEEFRQSILTWTPERAAPHCGVDPKLIRRAAREYAGHHPAMCFHGLGITEHTQGTDGVEILVQLAWITGQWGIPGAGVNPLRGQNNVQGAAHMGCEPQRLTGFVPLEQARPQFETLWKQPLPRTPGLDLPGILHAAQSGNIQLLWIIGYDIAQSHSNLPSTTQALEKIPHIIVQDLFLNEVARHHAHIFLPSCSSYEKDGTFMNSERRVQKVRACLTPRGNSHPDWMILRDVAALLGGATHFPYHHPREIWDEIRQAWPGGRGISWERLDQQGLQWPCPDTQHPGTPILHTDHHLPHSAQLRAVPYLPTSETTSPLYPFLLTTGRNLFHFNAGTMTRRTANQALRAEDLLEISPADAEQLRIQKGDPIRVRSRHGSVELRAQPDPRVAPGQCFATFHHQHSPLNQLTSTHADTTTHTPEFKVVAVHLEHARLPAPFRPTTPTP